MAEMGANPIYTMFDTVMRPSNGPGVSGHHVLALLTAARYKNTDNVANVYVIPEPALYPGFRQPDHAVKDHWMDRKPGHSVINRFRDAYLEPCICVTRTWWHDRIRGG